MSLISMNGDNISVVLWLLMLCLQISWATIGLTNPCLVVTMNFHYQYHCSKLTNIEQTQNHIWQIFFGSPLFIFSSNNILHLATSRCKVSKCVESAHCCPHSTYSSRRLLGMTTLIALETFRLNPSCGENLQWSSVTFPSRSLIACPIIPH